jgi:YD repeat-containing protein
MQRLLGVGALVASVLLWGPGSAGAQTYTYDALGRLKSSTSSGGATSTYTYDAADNIIAVSVSGQPPPTSTTTWDRTKADSNWTFATNDLTAINDAYASSVIATTGLSATAEGEFSVTVQNPQTTQIGLSRLETNSPPADVGGSSDTVGMRQDGKIYGNTFTQYADLGSPPASGDVITVHLKNGKAWFRKNSDPWNPGIAGADPSNDATGIPTPALTTTHPNLYPIAYAGGDGPGNAAGVQYLANFSAWGTGSPPPPPSSTTWNAASGGSAWSVSGNTATNIGYAGSILATTGHSTGEYEFFVTVQNPHTTQIGLTRLANHSGDLGSTADSIAMRQDGTVYMNFQPLTSLGAPVSGDMIDVYLKNGKVWFRKYGQTWNPGVPNANPLTGVGGFDIPVLSPTNPNLYPAAYAEGDGPGGGPDTYYVGNFSLW